MVWAGFSAAKMPLTSANGGFPMPVFVMLTRVDPQVLRTPHSLEELEKHAAEAIRTQCPDVKWVSNYAVLGPHDYVDVFEAPDIETAAKVSTLIRTFGRAHSEIWPATDWKKFKAMLKSMPAASR
jgi:uncharacterized protein with GYD domain